MLLKIVCQFLIKRASLIKKQAQKIVCLLSLKSLSYKRCLRLFYKNELNTAVLPAVVNVFHIDNRVLAAVSERLEA